MHSVESKQEDTTNSHMRRIEPMGKRERERLLPCWERAARLHQRRRSIGDGFWKRAEEQQIWRRRGESSSLSLSINDSSDWCVALCLLYLFHSLSRPISLPSRLNSLSRLVTSVSR
jgi:transposase